MKNMPGSRIPEKSSGLAVLELSGAGAGSDSQEPAGPGALIINADDWGRDRNTTNRALDCIRCATVSSASAMVFMEDSERAAATALEHKVSTGLHLNFTTPFSASGVALKLAEHQQKLTRHLRLHRLAPVVYHPALSVSFEYVVKAQLEEFQRLYGLKPERIDGHHHMHLCANVIFGNLLPSGTIVRRNFSFSTGEKGLANRVYREVIDRIIRRRHDTTDLMFALPPLDPPDRLRRIFALTGQFSVEVETHPVHLAEYRYLTQGEVLRQAEGLPIAASYAIPYRRFTAAA
jgi:predicted glycoside hydrolase/deacetylase ChbG (UPF0249 family)